MITEKNPFISDRLTQATWPELEAMARSVEIEIRGTGGGLFELTRRGSILSDNGVPIVQALMLIEDAYENANRAEELR